MIIDLADTRHSRATLGGGTPRTAGPWLDLVVVGDLGLGVAAATDPTSHNRSHNHLLTLVAGETGPRVFDVDHSKCAVALDIKAGWGRGGKKLKGPKSKRRLRWL